MVFAHFALITLLFCRVSFQRINIQRQKLNVTRQIRILSLKKSPLISNSVNADQETLFFN